MDRIYPHGTWVHQNTTSSNRRAVRSESGMLSARKGENLRRNVMFGKKLPGMGGSQCLYLTFGDLERVKGRRKKTEVTERKTIAANLKLLIRVNCLVGAGSSGQPFRSQLDTAFCTDTQETGIP